MSPCVEHTSTPIQLRVIPDTALAWPTEQFEQKKVKTFEIHWNKTREILGESIVRKSRPNISIKMKSITSSPSKINFSVPPPRFNDNETLTSAEVEIQIKKHHKYPETFLYRHQGRYNYPTVSHDAPHLGNTIVNRKRPKTGTFRKKERLGRQKVQNWTHS